jgi:hypothetical protein
MAQWVLKDNGKVVPRRSIHCLSAAKLAPSNEDKHSKREIFSTSICGLLGDSISLPATPLQNLIEDYWEMEPYGDDKKMQLPFLRLILLMQPGNLLLNILLLTL